MLSPAERNVLILIGDHAPNYRIDTTSPTIQSLEEFGLITVLKVLTDKKAGPGDHIINVTRQGEFVITELCFLGKEEVPVRQRYEEVSLSSGELPEINDRVIILLECDGTESFGPNKGEKVKILQSVIAAREEIEGKTKWYLIGAQAYLIEEGEDGATAKVVSWLKKI